VSARNPLTIVPSPVIPDRPPSFTAGMQRALADRKKLLATALDIMGEQADTLSDIASLLIDALHNNGRLLIAGNGGSAAEAQHFATEMVGRFKRDRQALAAIALTADTAILTAIANDFGFEEVFARQVEAYGRHGDVFIAFSTSGESENLVRAARMAIKRGIPVVALTGSRANRLAAIAYLTFQVPTADTPLVQELHTVVLHLLCDVVESSLAL
jgi:D-sedoheptulose 7-phosphate isomerase